MSKPRGVDADCQHAAMRSTFSMQSNEWRGEPIVLGLPRPRAVERHSTSKSRFSERLVTLNPTPLLGYRAPLLQ